MRRLERAIPVPVRAFLALAILVVAVLVVIELAGSSGRGGAPAAVDIPAAKFDGAALPADTPAPLFTLRDVHGHSLSLASLRGQVVVLAFLYSGCVPGCVLIAQQIRGALDELPHPVPVVIVSVEPSADTPAAVARFLARVSLGGRVSYLTGPPGAIARTWRAYRVVTPSSGRGAFERAAPVYLIGREGHERVLYEQEELTPESLTHDIGELEAG